MSGRGSKESSVITATTDGALEQAGKRRRVIDVDGDRQRS